MLCQSCEKNQATTYIKKVVNGELTEMNLCTECAKEMGYGKIFGTGFDFSNLLGSFLGEGLPARTSATRCSGCGSSFADIARSGKVGCAGCYEVFYDDLLPSLKRIHGNTKHTGKRAEIKAQTPEHKIKSLKKQLKKAIEAQEFEEAAKLRDEIKVLEGGETK